MVIQQVRRLLADILCIDLEDVSTKSALTQDFGVEPLDLASLIIACEKTYKLTIHDEDVLTFKNIADLAAYIDQMLDEGLNDAPEVTEEDRTAWFYE